ncbi:MAG: pilus assembly protein [bacterium]|nr:pilus assembly protein [bacterium]
MCQKKNKGQALVEFVIILPIVLMFIFVIIDFSNVFYQKNHLENQINEVVTYKKAGKDNSFIKEKLDDNIQISYTMNNNLLEITLKKKIKLITPLSDVVVKNPFTIKTERTIINE